jgi:hypothetical protein
VTTTALAGNRPVAEDATVFSGMIIGTQLALSDLANTERAVVPAADGDAGYERAAGHLG